MIHASTRQVLANETPDDDRIPLVNEPIFDTRTPRKDVVYQIRSPDGTVVRKYVQVTEVYGERGIARCRVLRSFDDSANKIEGDVGQEMVVDIGCLTQPDVFPALATDIPKWVECSAMSMDEIREYAKSVIAGYFQTQVIAFDVTDDLDRTIRGIKSLLKGKIGGFFLTLLLGFLKAHIVRSIEKKTGVPDQKTAFQKKFSDSRYLFSKPGPGAVSEDEKKAARIKELQEQVKKQSEQQTEKEAKPVAKPVAKPEAKKPGLAHSLKTPGVKK